MRSAVDKRVISPPGRTLRNNGRYLDCAWCEALLPRTNRHGFCSRRCYAYWRRKVHPAELALLYRAGWTIRQLQQKYRTQESVIYGWLKRQGVQLRKRTPVCRVCGQPPTPRRRYKNLCVEHYKQVRSAEARRRKQRLRLARRRLATATAVACSC